MNFFEQELRRFTGTDYRFQILQGALRRPCLLHSPQRQPPRPAGIRHQRRGRPV